jgi:excisionase family DNA binding protein
MQKAPALEIPDSILLTERQVAERLHVSTSLVRKLRHNGGGPFFIRPGGKLVRYLGADVQAWLTAQRREPSAKASPVLQK